MGQILSKKLKYLIQWDLETVPWRIKYTGQKLDILCCKQVLTHSIWTQLTFWASLSVFGKQSDSSSLCLYETLFTPAHCNSTASNSIYTILFSIQSINQWVLMKPIPHYQTLPAEDRKGKTRFQETWPHCSFISVLWMSLCYDSRGN